MSNLLKDNKELIKEYDYKKNSNVDLNVLTLGSGRKIWWICEQGHEYLMSIVNKAKRRNGCPICANRIVLEGYNDLKSKFPELAKEWNYEKNGNLKPEQLVSGSNKRVWWKCKKCGYEWEATVVSRTITGNGCRNCAINSVGNKIKTKKIEKYGDLTKTHPQLVKEWDYEKNSKLKPENFHFGSTTKVWWKCPNGHEYEQIIYARAKDNYNCPICANENHSSFPEQVVFYYCKKIFGKFDVINRYKIQSQEIDIFIKQLNIAIEYDGYYYHNNNKTKSIENKKNVFLKNNNIKLIRIKENYDKDIFSDNNYDVISIKKNPTFEDLNAMLKKLFKRIGGIISKDISENFNVENDKINIMDSFIYNIKQNSLALKMPNIAKEWNYEKNGNLKPEMFSYASSRKVWWKCLKGHEWEDTINNRVHGNGCLICSNRKVLYGVNDFATRNPQIVKEWDYEKNGELKPEKIVFGYSKKVWWKCQECGYEWQISPASRTKGSKCPCCAKKIIVKGINDLKTTNPELLKEWNYERNGELKPEQVTRGSRKKVWWKCKNGHEWSALISNRTKGVGCPKCAINKLTVKNSKRVIQYTLDYKFIKEYKSITEAERRTGVKHISCVCSGKRKSAGGFVWKYR